MLNNLKKIQIIKTLALKRKVKQHFMKQGDNASEGGKHYNNSLFSFSISRFQSFFALGMNAKESLMENLQR